jgi:single-stranded DNA-binding protein
MDMQYLMLFGRTVADSELFESSNKEGRKFAVFTLAVNRYVGKGKDEEVTYYDCICFLPSAEKLFERVKKADKVLVQGRPTAEAYINKDGAAVGKIKVVVESWEVVK